MTSDLLQRADRHFRPDSQGVLAPKEQCRPGRVLVTVNAVVAQTAAGQHLAWMLVNQLSRQFGIVIELTLRVSDTPLLKGIAAFGVKDSLPDTLNACVQLVAGEHIHVNPQSDDEARHDVHIAIGGAIGLADADRAWCVYADGWRWYVGSGKGMPDCAPSSPLSFGPYMGATFVAGEVFKFLRSLLPGKGTFIEECIGSVWTMELGDSWEALPEGPDHRTIPILPHFYFAGAGAVAQAAAVTLGSSRIKGSATAIDHDALDVTNANRYVLATIADMNASKVELLSAYLTANGFPCHPAPVKWDAYVASLGRLAMNPEIAALERQSRFPLVLSCVDKNVPRHQIQSALPHMILGSSTDGLVAKTSVFYLQHDAGCLKCFNPPEDRNAIVQSNRDRLAHFTPEKRRAWCIERGVSEDDLTRLVAPPECGKLNEADLERFANGPPEMSVAFVSVAAGVLMAAQLVRIVMTGISVVTKNGHTVVATFSTAGLRQRSSAVDHKCDCETTRLRARWRQLWKDELT